MNRKLKISLIFLSLSLSLVKCSFQKQLFVCEGSSLTLTCERGTVINIIRANFGRFSNSVCSSNSKDTTWSTLCIQPTTLRKVKHLCGGKSRCSVPVSSSQFGDPCYDTPKYLQLLYSCIDEELAITESTMIPLWLMSIEELSAAFTESPDLTTSSSTQVTTTKKVPSIKKFLRHLEKMEAKRKIKNSLEESSLTSVNTKVRQEDVLEAIPYSADNHENEKKTIILAAAISLLSCTFIIFFSIVISHRMRKKKKSKMMNHLQSQEQSAYSQYISDHSHYQPTNNHSFFLTDKRQNQKIPNFQLPLKNYSFQNEQKRVSVCNGRIVMNTGKKVEPDNPYMDSAYMYL